MEVRLYQGLIELNWNLLFSLITVLVLMLILKHFFFEKVHNFMVERQKGVEEQLASAEEKNKEADALLDRYKQTLSGAENEGKRLIKEACTNASAQAEEIIATAKKKADSIVDQAEKRAEAEQDKALHDIKDQVAEIAVMAAQHILEKELSGEVQEEIVDKAIEEVGNAKWRG